MPMARNARFVTSEKIAVAIGSDGAGHGSPVQTAPWMTGRRPGPNQTRAGSRSSAAATAAATALTTCRLNTDGTM